MMGSAEEPDIKPRKMHKLKTKITAKARSLFAKKHVAKDEKETVEKVPREDTKMKIITPTSISNNLDRTRMLLLEKKFKCEEEKKRKNSEADRSPEHIKDIQNAMETKFGEEDRNTEITKKHTGDIKKGIEKKLSDEEKKRKEDVKKEDNRENKDFVFVSVKPKSNSQSSNDSGFLDSAEFVGKPQKTVETKMFEFAAQETMERLRKTNERQKRIERRTEDEDDEAALIEELVKLEISIDPAEDTVTEGFKKLAIDESEGDKRLAMDESEGDKRLAMDESEGGKKKHMKQVLITRKPVRNKDFRIPCGPYQQQINQVNERIFSGGRVIVQEPSREPDDLIPAIQDLFDGYRAPAQDVSKQVEDCMNQVMAVLPNDVIDTILESQSAVENYEWSSPEHNFSPYEDNRSPESCFSSPSQRLPNVEITQDMEYYSRSPEDVRAIVRASPNYAVPSLSNDGFEKETAFALQNFEKLFGSKAFDGANFDDARIALDDAQKVLGAHVLDSTQKEFDGSHILYDTQKVFGTHILDDTQKAFDGSHTLDNTQKVFDSTHVLDTHKVFEPAYDSNFDPVFNDLTCQDVLNDEFILRLSDGPAAGPLTPPRSNDSRSPPSPSYASPKYAEFNSPQSDDFAMSPNGRIQKTERTYTFASSPERDSTTPTIKLDRLDEEKEEDKLKRQTPINMSMFKKQMQALATKYAAMSCCQKERTHPKEALVRHLEQCSRDQRRHMTVTLARLDIVHVFQLLYYRVLPALESPAGEHAAREHADCALVSLACQRLLAEKPEVFLDEDYGLALLSRAAMRCALRPELTRYLVWCIRRALNTRPLGTGPVFTQTDVAGDNLAGALARLGDSHAECLSELLAREPRDRPLLDLEHRNTEGYSALHLACQLHNSRTGPQTTHTVHVLMTHGGVPVTLPDNKSGNTALHCAVDAGGCDLQLVLTLFQDVPPNKRRSLAYCKNAGMKTPIELARCASRTRPDYPKEVLEFLKKCRT